MIATLKVADRDGDTIMSASPLVELGALSGGEHRRAAPFQRPLTPAGRLLAREDADNRRAQMVAARTSCFRGSRPSPPPTSPSWAGMVQSSGALEVGCVIDQGAPSPGERLPGGRIAAGGNRAVIRQLSGTEVDLAGCSARVGGLEAGDP